MKASRVVNFDEISAKEFVEVFSSLMKKYQELSLEAATRELDTDRLSGIREINQARRDLLFDLPDKAKDIFSYPSRLEHFLVRRIANCIEGLHDLDPHNNKTFPDAIFLDKLISNIKKVIT